MTTPEKRMRIEAVDSPRAMAMYIQSRKRVKDGAVILLIHQRGEQVQTAEGLTIQANENQRVVEYWVDPKIQKEFEEDVRYELDEEPDN